MAQQECATHILRRLYGSGVAHIPGETWAYVPGYSRLYAVSDLGRALSFKRKAPRILALCPESDGYIVVSFSKGRRPRSFRLHRVVARCFLSPAPSDRQINHKNGNKQDNRASNLEWVTARENVIHSHRTGLTSIGERHHMATLSFDQVKKIRQASGSYSVLAREYGVGKSTVARIKKLETRLHG